MRFAATFAVILVMGPATAAEPQSFDYDCDVPANRFSSVSTKLPGPSYLVTGSVVASTLRNGDNLPVAGVRFVDDVNKKAIGFRLVADNAKADQFHVVISAKDGDIIKEGTVGAIPVKDIIPFNINLSESGALTLTVEHNTYKLEAAPLEYAKVMVFCSTGQFKFSGISFVAEQIDAK